MSSSTWHGFFLDRISVENTFEEISAGTFRNTNLFVLKKSGFNPWAPQRKRWHGRSLDSGALVEVSTISGFFAPSLRLASLLVAEAIIFDQKTYTRSAFPLATPTTKGIPFCCLLVKVYIGGVFQFRCVENNLWDQVLPKQYYHQSFGTQYYHLEPQTTIYNWMFGETTIFCIKIWNHPIETSIYKWLFGVPGMHSYLSDWRPK